MVRNLRKKFDADSRSGAILVEFLLWFTAAGVVDILSLIPYVGVIASWPFIGFFFLYKWMRGLNFKRTFWASLGGFSFETLFSTLPAALADVSVTFALYMASEAASKLPGGATGKIIKKAAIVGAGVATGGAGTVAGEAAAAGTAATAAATAGEAATAAATAGKAATAVGGAAAKGAGAAAAEGKAAAGAGAAAGGGAEGIPGTAGVTPGQEISPEAMGEKLPPMEELKKRLIEGIPEQLGQQQEQEEENEDEEPPLVIPT